MEEKDIDINDEEQILKNVVFFDYFYNCEECSRELCMFYNDIVKQKNNFNRRQAIIDLGRIAITLNQQDKRIKELENYLDEEIESNVNLYNLQSKTEQENQQLKKQLAEKEKEQNQKAIEQLEKVKEIIDKNCFYNMSGDCRIFYKLEVDYQINQRINKLKGKVEDVKD